MRRRSGGRFGWWRRSGFPPFGAAQLVKLCWLWKADWVTKNFWCECLCCAFYVGDTVGRCREAGQCCFCPCYTVLTSLNFCCSERVFEIVGRNFFLNCVILLILHWQILFRLLCSNFMMIWFCAWDGDWYVVRDSKYVVTSFVRSKMVPRSLLGCKCGYVHELELNLWIWSGC